METGFEPYFLLVQILLSILPIAILIPLGKSLRAAIGPRIIHVKPNNAEAPFFSKTALAWTIAFLPLAVPILMLIYFVPVPFSQLPNSQFFSRWGLYWGGNPNEVYTVFLIFSVMVLGFWGPSHLILIQLLGTWLGLDRRTISALRFPTFVAFALSFIIASVLDHFHGEGPFLGLFLLFIAPILMGSGYWLEWLTLKAKTNGQLILLLVSFTVIQIAFGFFYVLSEGFFVITLALWLLPASALIHRGFGRAA